MLENLRDNLIVPIANRLGTAAGAALAPLGIGADTEQQVAVWIAAGVLVAVDLVNDWLTRRRREAKS